MIECKVAEEQDKNKKLQCKLKSTENKMQAKLEDLECELSELKNRRNDLDVDIHRQTEELCDLEKRNQEAEIYMSSLATESEKESQKLEELNNQVDEN